MTDPLGQRLRSLHRELQRLGVAESPETLRLRRVEVLAREFLHQLDGYRAETQTAGLWDEADEVLYTAPSLVALRAVLEKR